MSLSPLTSSQAELVNKLANDPGVLGQLGYVWLDFSGFFDRPGNIALGGDDGVALFGNRGRGEFEGHYLFSPRLRGKPALDAAKAMLGYMFTTVGARVIVGETPADNRAARLFSRALGFTRRGTTIDASGRPCVVYEMDRERWATLSAVSSVA